MHAVSLQLTVMSRPLLGPTENEVPALREEWYSRIAEGCGWMVEAWTNKYLSTAPIALGEAEGILRVVLDRIAEIAEADCQLLVLDLSSHCFRYQDWDALSNDWEERLRPFPKVIIILHKCAPVTDSTALDSLHSLRISQSRELVVIDPTGTRYDLTKRGKDRRLPCTSARRHASTISQNEFSRIVRSLSRRCFGHFVSPGGSHLRTHYDISRVVRDDRAYDYLLKQLKLIRSSEEFDLILGVGLGSEGLLKLCDDMRYDLGVSHTFHSEANKDDVREHFDAGQRRTLIVTDVILTGNTVKDLIAWVRGLGGEVVHVVSVIGLLNSRAEAIDGVPITYCADLKRPFFYNEAACPLCRTSLIKPIPITSAEDFLKGHEREVDHYDFWELVRETDSLEIGHELSTNGINHYIAKINTAALLSKYGDFVGSVLAKKVVKALGQSPIDAIACPIERDESPARGGPYLAYEIAKSLGVPVRKVIGIDREHLEMCTPNAADDRVAHNYREKFNSLAARPNGVGGPEHDGLSFRTATRKRLRVLAVDDGVNSGHTLVHMVTLLRSVGVEVNSYAVLLYAASQRDADTQIRNAIGNGFHYFYRWTLGPFPKSKCPECTARSGRG